MPVEHGEQFLRVRQADEVAPGAADDDRVMVQADQRMARRVVAECRLECRKFALGEFAIVFVGVRRIEEHDLPAVGNKPPADVEAVARQHRGERRRMVVIAGQTVDRRTEPAGQRLEAAIARRRAVLRQIARREHNVGRLGADALDDRRKRRMGVDLAQPPVRLGEQVAVGDLDEMQAVFGHRRDLIPRTSDKGP